MSQFPQQQIPTARAVYVPKRRKKSNTTAFVILVLCLVVAGGIAWVAFSPSAKSTLSTFSDPNKRVVNEALVKAMNRRSPFNNEKVVADYEILKWYEPRETLHGNKTTSGLVFHAFNPIMESGLGVQVDYRWQGTDGLWTDEQTVYIVRGGRVYDSIPANHILFPHETGAQFKQRVGGNYPEFDGIP